MNHHPGLTVAGRDRRVAGMSTDYDQGYDPDLDDDDPDDIAELLGDSGNYDDDDQDEDEAAG